VFLGFNMTFFTQFILGSRGMPRRYYDYLPHFQPLHAFSSIGAYVLGIGFLIMLYMFIDAIRNGKKAPPNPWGSAGYEWMTTSPPHPHNFHETPVMTRGPYDYHLATDEELSTGFPGESEATVETRAEAAGAARGEAPKSAAPSTDTDDSDSDEKSKDDDE
jgi:cytochrome c oxidase subunit 1